MLNHTALIGRIGKEIELRTTNNGTDVATFSLAVQRNYNKDITDWINIVAWKGTATLISKHFKKGDLICIEGSIQTRDYEDKEGKKVYVTEVVADKVHFVTGKREANNPAPNTANTFGDDTSSDDFMPLDIDDDLPFA